MAKSVKALITPEVLKWAREGRIRLELNDAARRLKVDSEQLAAWEAGTDQPTFTQLKRIANVYKTHLSVFYLSEPPADFRLLADHRRFPQSTSPDEDQAYRLNANIIEAHERRETLIEFYELLGESPPEVTLELNETDDPDFSIALQTVRGFCIAQKPFPVIVLNPKDSPYGRVFTIIHELVHVALGKSVIQNTGFRGHANLNPTEVFCNEVAGEVLVPKDELLERVNLHTLETDLPKLSKHFHVSREAIMTRLRTIGYISKPTYEAYIQSQQEKYKDSPPTGGPIPYHTRLLYAAGEHFARTAFTAYHEQKITLADLAASFSKCDPKHVFEIEGVIFA